VSFDSRAERRSPCRRWQKNTDLDLQPKKQGIHKLIVIGLLAHTCVESIVRFAAELGYEVTMVKDATTSFTDEQMHAALRMNIPNHVSAIVTTNELVDAISSLSKLLECSAHYGFHRTGSSACMGEQPDRRATTISISRLAQIRF
jgi:hypothetical protein